MSRALVLLNCLWNIAGWRSLLTRGRGSVSALLGQIVVLLFLAGSASAWLSAVAYVVLSPPDDLFREWVRANTQAGAQMVPLPLLLFLLLAGALALFERPLQFSPTEIDFLSAGPFHRRQLVNYKLGASLFSHATLAFVFAAPAGSALSGVLPVFVGSLLLFCFIHLLVVFAGLLGTAVGLQDARGGRRLVITLGFIIAVPAIAWLSFGKNRADPVKAYRQFALSPLCRVATAPLHWFVNAILVQRLWPDLLVWSALCLAVNGILFAAVHALDARIEAQADAEAREAPRAAIAGRPVERVPLAFPLLSRYQGMGPIAWRQFMNVLRKPEGIVATLVLYVMTLSAGLAVTIGPHSILFLPTLDGRLELNPVGARMCGAAAMLLPMLAASRLQFDFRGDVGRFDVLKALPIGPLAVTGGQLLVPVLIVWAMQWGALAATAVVLRSTPASLWIAAAFAPPVSVALMAIENLPTFWIPVRHTAGKTPEPFEMIGLVLLHPLLRLLGYCATITVTFAVSVSVYFMFGQSIAAILIAAWLTLATGGMGLVALLAHVFDRFDVTREATL